MPRPGVTQEQVIQAVEAIAAEGGNPTVLAVRKRLGGGSPNRITPWLAEWRASQAATEAKDLPEIPAAVDNAMRHVWALAWQHAQEQLATERQALSKARQSSETEREELLAEISRLDGELETLTNAREQTEATLREAQQAHAQTLSDEREAKALAEERQRRIVEQGEELQRLRTERDEALARAARAEATAEPLRADLQRAHEAILTYRKELNGLPAERERLLEQVERLQAEHTRERETARQSKQALDLGGKKIKTLELTLQEERQARQAAEQRLTELRIDMATLSERAAQTDHLTRLLERFGGPHAPPGLDTHGDD